MLQIKETLKQRGLTQNELAERLGINRVSLSRLLSDKNDMRVSTIKKIAACIVKPENAVISALGGFCGVFSRSVV